MKELKPLKSAFEKIRLSHREKQTGRNDFLKFMEKHPASEAVPANSWDRFISRFLAFTRRPVLTTATVLGVFVIFGGGISYAAESTVPGDLLYPFKVRVNEEVRGFFQFNSGSQAEWEINKMERRFEEVRILEEKGELDGKTKFELKEELNVYTKTFEQQVKILEEEGKVKEAEEIKSNFESVFEIHQDEAAHIEFDVAGFDPIKDTEIKPIEPKDEEPQEEAPLYEDPTGEPAVDVETTIEISPIEVEVESILDPNVIQLPKRVS